MRKKKTEQELTDIEDALRELEEKYHDDTNKVRKFSTELNNNFKGREK